MLVPHVSPPPLPTRPNPFPHPRPHISQTSCTFSPCPTPSQPALPPHSPHPLLYAIRCLPVNTNASDPDPKHKENATQKKSDKCFTNCYSPLSPVSPPPPSRSRIPSPPPSQQEPRTHAHTPLERRKPTSHTPPTSPPPQDTCCSLSPLPSASFSISFSARREEKVRSLSSHARTHTRIPPSDVLQVVVYLTGPSLPFGRRCKRREKGGLGGVCWGRGAGAGHTHAPACSYALHAPSIGAE